jgi:hypothetical protein
MPCCRNATIVTEFLRDALAADALGVPELETRARAAGLLGERQHITDAKAFKRAKKSLGIRSRRIGFGPRSQWLWELSQPNEPCLRTEQPEAGQSLAFQPIGSRASPVSTLIVLPTTFLGTAGGGS